MKASRPPPPDTIAAVAAVIAGGGAGIRIDASSTTLGSRPRRSQARAMIARDHDETDNPQDDVRARREGEVRHADPRVAMASGA